MQTMLIPTRNIFIIEYFQNDKLQTRQFDMPPLFVNKFHNELFFNTEYNPRAIITSVTPIASGNDRVICKIGLRDSESELNLTGRVVIRASMYKEFLETLNQSLKSNEDNKVSRVLAIRGTF